ncbi:MAG TPA: hypothetical protein VGU45_05210 [Microvirga sp.]|jgi:hypothetical protein|nr:hypothetical protein [Microvirga sp.]
MKGIRLARVAIGAAALMLAAAPGAMAQEEGVLAKSILGSIGIIPKDPPKIDYRERAPLVLPSKTELPAPVSSDAVEAKAANWPKDPDVMAARKEAAEARKPWTQTEEYRNSEGKRLSIEEIRAGRRAGASTRQAPSLADERRAEFSRLTPEELRAFSKQDDAKLDPTQLKRRYLTDPPQDLLKAAGNAPLKATVDPRPMGDPDSPQAFQREQAARR